MVRYSFWTQALIFTFVIILIMSFAALIYLLGF